MGGIDVTVVRSEILDSLVAITAVGAAVLLLVVAIHAFRWIRVALEIDGYEQWEDNDDLDDNVFDDDVSGDQREDWLAANMGPSNDDGYYRPDPDEEDDDVFDDRRG